MKIKKEVSNQYAKNIQLSQVADSWRAERDGVPKTAYCGVNVLFV